MRRIDKLWPTIVSYENLYAAWLRARRGKMRRPMVAHFAELQRRIADPHLLNLLQHIIDSGPARPKHLGLAPFYPGDDLLTAEELPAGLPIGNFASQVFANLYLDAFDHWVQEQCRPRGYLRYVDDMWFFDRDKQRLWDLAEKIQEKLLSLRLSLHGNRITLRRAIYQHYPLKAGGLA